MSIKPSTTSSSAFPLPAASLLRLSGRDAIAFAQAQFANDVARLQDGQWQWNLWLSSKGRVVALFALLRLDGENLLAWLPDYPATQLAEQLTGFRFRSKLTIDALNDAASMGLFAAPSSVGLDADTAQAAITRGVDGQWQHIALDLGGATPRTLLLYADASTLPELGIENRNTEHEARWQLLDIGHGLPRLSGAQIEAFTPQMLGLERLSAFSVKKGCYPGQEIVARVHFLGQAKRSTLRLALNQTASPGTRLRNEAGAQAEIISIANDGDHVEALAIAPVDAGDSLFQSEDGQVQGTPFPLLDRLSR